MPADRKVLYLATSTVLLVAWSAYLLWVCFRIANPAVG